MKRLLASLIGLFVFAASAHAISTPNEWNYIPTSSFTDTTTGGAPVLLSSYPAVQFVGVMVGSAAPGAFLALYKSTGPVWDPGLSTWTFINLDYNFSQAGPTQYEFYDLKSTSFTWIQKVGNARITMFFHCAKPTALKLNEPIPGFCPGFPINGR